MTANSRVFEFNRDTHEFTVHPRVGYEKHVKSIDVHPLTGRTVWVKAEQKYYGKSVYLLGPDGRLSFPGHLTYKARWLVRER